METKNKKINLENKLIEELEETCLRLHSYCKRLETDNDGFKALTKITEKQTPSIFRWKDKLLVAPWREYTYYMGKMMAYMFVLNSLGYPEVPALIVRLRGIQFDDRGAKATQTKNIKPIDDV